MGYGDLYVDMDGVLVDFLFGVKLQTGYDWNAPAKNKEEKRTRGNAAFESGQQFWIDLPPMRDYRVLWDFVSPSNPHILTAVPRGFEGEGPTETSVRYAKDGKWIWNQLYIGTPRERFHVVFREEKQNFSTSVVNGEVISNVLIDDHEPNITEWVRNRGIGILHTSAEETIKQLGKLAGHNGY
jgi:hypothetical protein